MSSGGKGGRSTKGSRQGTDRNSGGGTTHNHQPKSDHNHNEKDKDSILHKIAPTAEQLRIAQMIDNTHSEPEKVLQEKINQVMQVTGVSQDDAIVALHDCDNDVTAAIDALLEGEGHGEWRESTKKKKKAPASKTKEEVESNKENRRVETRERSSSKPRGASGAPPRFRGRGGGRGGREDSGDGYSRGAGSRRGKMSNGTVPASRGRGTRGRGSSSLTSRTFQKRQPPSFTETIDTWGAAPTDKIENSANDLQIDNWDEETSGTTEDWDGEWTGSLDTTTVFRPSSGTGVNVPLNDVQDTSSNISNTGPILSSNLGSVGSVIGSPSSTDVTSSSRGTNSLELQQNLAESVNNVLSLGQSQLSTSPMNVSSAFVPSSGAMTITQSQAIDLAALLQKAAPHSTVGRLPPQMVDTSAMCSASLVGDTKQSIHSGISSSVGDSLKASVQINNRVSSVSSSGSQSYSPSSSMSNSMFSNSVSSLGNSLTSSSGASKVLGLTAQNSSLTSRSKPPSRRLPHSSSKIPSSAVEMPEVAMAALDMQFTGLEFGTESFDFTSDVKPVMGSNLVSGSMGSSRDPSVAKELNSLNSSLGQQQTLGPQPIPYPTHANERKPPSASLLSNTQRSSGSMPTSVVTSQSLADLTKKDSSPGGGHLGRLVESSSSAHSAYQSSSGAIYGSKTSSNFPSPPTAHYAQTSSQNYSSCSQSGAGNNSYGGSGVSNNVGSSNSCNSNQTSGGGYGSGYAVQASVSSGQYQNNYVNVSSHSLASISVPKTQTNTGLKDPSQNYNDSSASSLSSSLSTNASAGGSNNGTGGLSSSMNSVSSSSIQSTKPSVPGKIVNSMGSTVPPNVQQHSVTQSQQQQQLHVTQQQLNQHHQTHHHLQQQQVAQQAQQTQMLAGPGPSQYVSTQTAALQGSLPPTFYNVQQPAMYSFEDLQMFQRVPHMPQAPTTLAGGRDGTITSPGSYSVADVAKFRTDQNSSPVPSTINQQGAAAAGTYIQATQNAALPPFYMYQPMPTVPSNFTQYGTPAIILPPSTHTGSNSTQFPGPPKLPYGQGASTYYDAMSQNQDYKAGYGTGTQAQNKAGPNPSGSAPNSASDLTGYKNHLGKYDKQGFHSANPQTFNMAGSGTNPMTANYTQMFIPTMPAAAQHHSTMMHHQLHQVRSNQMDGGSSAAQRTGSAGGQSKGGSKGGYSGSYWGAN